MNCPNCDAELPDRPGDPAIFCHECARQVRCRSASCGRPLVAGARACNYCGTMVGDGATNTAHLDRERPQIASLNKVEFVETSKRRSLNAELTDAAVESLSNSVGMFMAGRSMATGLDRIQRRGDQAAKIDREQPALPELFTATQNGKVIELTNEGDATHPGELDSKIQGGARPAPVEADRDSISQLMTDLDRSAHPEVPKADRALERSLHLLRIAKDEYGIDGMTAPQIADVLTDKFRIATTPQAVRAAFDRAVDLVDRIPTGGGGFRYRLMAAGESFLADPQASRILAHTRKRSARSRAAGRNAKVGGDAEQHTNGKAAVIPAKSATGRPSPKEVVAELVMGGFFATAKTSADIRKHLEEKLGYRYRPNDMSATLLRLTRGGKLARTQGANNQYEYISK